MKIRPASKRSIGSTGSWGLRDNLNQSAAKIPEKIGVLFQDKHRDAGPGQQKTQHHSGRSSTGNAALNRGGFRHHSSDMRRDMREEELYAEN
jgi:hypothetical protein